MRLSPLLVLNNHLPSSEFVLLLALKNLLPVLFQQAQFLALSHGYKALGTVSNMQHIGNIYFHV